MDDKVPHTPVLLEETLSLWLSRECGLYLDGTTGAGGHAQALLDRTAGTSLIGIDRDPAALKIAEQRLQRFGKRVRLLRGNFRQLRVLLEDLGVNSVDGCLFDIGASSMQFAQSERGFSYQVDAPLDMRMDPENPVTAAKLVNSLPEKELAALFWRYGEERWAKRISAGIIRRRQRQPLNTTGELVEVVKNAIPAAVRREGHHPAKQAFQALRIVVNDELGALREGLHQALDVTLPGGRVCVISFHSLEDRIVKEIFRQYSGVCTCPPEVPVCTCGRKARVRILTKRPIRPGSREIQLNPRSRSAKLRAVEVQAERYCSKQKGGVIA